MGNINIRKLIEAYAKRCVEDMDMDELCTFAQNTIEDELDQCTNQYVIDTINDYYPDLIDDAS